MKWRSLSDQEAATLPEARLGGSLLLVVAAAVSLLVVAAIGTLLWTAALRAIGLRYMIAVGLIGVWSLLFVTMTALRLRQTPLVASIGLMAWVSYRLGVVVADDPLLHWPLLVDLLGEALMGAGFCGYMASAVRPNAYYRRRLPTV
ncbi:hypothetical protein SAMN02745126_01518 [Enhydrobacter aerosaccus]|uniref:Uncharacterized protein n=1 Tax=Enhydrobacter aerosaccus TaxID=225324 RepID=A0A1T4LFD8_9HYPH|nr:hypothetical protein [Enhydrobacter aerosaccus]SJZ53287.1 hypothetical protein SAMN02745126_01518 [Enhydrobacter aerosaccus]